jgi:Flp pilus assembly protein TadG
VSFALALMAFAIAATAVVDVGLLVNDRRDAQADVDRAALAGALALSLDTGDSIDDSVAARQAARSWAASNGIDESDPTVVLTVTVISNCYSLDDGVPTGVRVTVEREPATFLARYLGVEDWHTTATATACAGRPTEMYGFLPFALSQASNCFETNGDGERVPLLGQFCDLVIDSNSQGLSGELGIDPLGECEDGNSSASVLYENIVEGTQTACAIGDTVVGNSGHNVGQTQSGIGDRLAGEGACDANFPIADQSLFNLGVNAINGDSPDILTDLYPPYNTHGDGIDDFFEVWQLPPAWTSGDHPAGDLVPYDCDPTSIGWQTSPRNVALLVIADFAAPDGSAGPKSYIVRSFARVYIEGCSDSNNLFYRDCAISGGGKFTIHARFVDQVAVSDAALGLDAGYGDIEVFLRD